MICGDHHVTRDESCSLPSICKGSVMAITGDLVYSKVCVRWVPRMLTGAHTGTKKAVATNLLHQYDNGGEGFLSQTGTRNEAPVHHFKPNFKQKLLNDAI